MKEIFFHTTRDDYAKSIIEEKKFKHSKHKEDTKIMWLGDGIYFWDSSSIAQKLGRSLVENKPENRNCSSKLLYCVVDYDEDKCLDLSLKEEFDDFFSCGLELLVAKYENMRDILDRNISKIESTKNALKNQEFWNNKEHGNFFGNITNEVIDYMKKVENKNIQVMKCSFRQNDVKYFLNEKNVVNQLCVKDCDIIKEINELGD